MQPNQTYTIAGVSYLNTIPFVYGINQSGLLPDARLQLMVPSACAESLRQGRSQIALVPVGALSKLHPYHIISNYCIGAEGNVRTVLLLSNVPMSQVTRVFLDGDSNTSVLLARILADKIWNIKPQWQPVSEIPDNLQPTDALVAIGDKTFNLQKRFRHVTDLAGEWMKMTGLPFVFAVWVTRVELPAEFLTRFDQALTFGITNIEKAIQTHGRIDLPADEAMKYLTNNINYNLTPEKMEALQLFLEMASKVPSFNPETTRCE